MKKLKLILLSGLMLGAMISSATVFTGKFTSSLNDLRRGVSVVEVSLDDETNLVHIKATGRLSSYFGFGFGTLGMAGSYALVFNSTAGDVDERRFTARTMGTSLASTVTNVTRVEDTAAGTVTIEFDRALTIGEAGYYDFVAQEGSIPMIYSIGATNSLANHGTLNKGTTSLVMTENVSTGIENGVVQFVSFYPNPATDVVNIDFSGDFVGTKVMIMTIDYKPAKQLEIQSSADKAIDVSDLSPGIYLVSFENQTHQSMYRVEVQ